MSIESWSKDQERYNLSETVYLQKADPEDWGVYCSVYYSSEYNGFFKESVYDFFLKRDPFWIYEGTKKIGGLVIAPNVIYLLYFIPPFREEAAVMHLLKKALMQWSDPSSPITAYEILPDQSDLFARAGFWPGEFRCRWMQRPTEIFSHDWEESYTVLQPEIIIENDKRRLKSDREIGHFLYKSFAGGIESTRRNQQSFQDYITNLEYYAYECNEHTLAASTLVYDKQTHALIGVCLVSMQDSFPAVYEIAVLSGYTGRGIATYMLKRALTILKQQQFPVLRLYVMQGNRAESVYYNLGFIPGPLEIQQMRL